MAFMFSGLVMYLLCLCLIIALYWIFSSVCTHVIIIYIFYSSVDPVKGQGLDVKNHAIVHLLPSKTKNFILSYPLSLSLSLSL